MPRSNCAMKSLLAVSCARSKDNFLHIFYITYTFFKFEFQVSWIRYTDTSLLTVGRYTYTTDLRFEAFHSPHTDDWIVRLKNPRPSDSGFYGCQISTTPHRTQLIYLTVHGRFFPYLFFYATIKLRKVQFLVHLPPRKLFLWGISLPTHRWLDFTFEKTHDLQTLVSMGVKFLQPHVALNLFYSYHDPVKFLQGVSNFKKLSVKKKSAERGCLNLVCRNRFF